MSVLDKLACALGRRDEIPNRDLARLLVETHDSDGVGELVVNLWNKDKGIQSDCIKALDEVGYLEPGMVAPYALDLLDLLESRDNRLVWGVMLALSTIGELAAEELFPRWQEICRAMDGGTVITRDGGVLALAGIACSSPERGAVILPYLLDHLRTCRPKDVPQHCEKILPALGAANSAEFISVLEKRSEDLQAAPKKRVERVIRLARQRWLERKND